jgi:hypothetical protein
MTMPRTHSIAPNDLTNVTNPFQGELRVSGLDVNLLTFAAAVDDTYLQQLKCHRNPMQLHVTCCDHLDPDALLQVKRQLMQQIKLKGPITCWYGPTRRAIHSDLAFLPAVSMAEAYEAVLGGVMAIAPDFYSLALEQMAQLMGRTNDDAFRAEVAEHGRSLPSDMD